MVSCFANRAVAKMWALVQFVSNECAGLKAAKAPMLFDENPDSIWVGRGKEQITFPDVVFFHYKWVLQKTPDDGREFRSSRDPSANRACFHHIQLHADVRLTFTQLRHLQFV